MTTMIERMAGWEIEADDEPGCIVLRQGSKSITIKCDTVTVYDHSKKGRAVKVPSTSQAITAALEEGE